MRTTTITSKATAFTVAGVMAVSVAGFGLVPQAKADHMAAPASSMASMEFSKHLDKMLAEIRMMDDKSAILANKYARQIALYSGIYNNKLEQASKKYTVVYAAHGRDAARNAYVDMVSKARADYVNSLEMSRNNIDRELSMMGEKGMKARNMFINHYNMQRDWFVNHSEMEKNNFLSGKMN